MAIEILVRHWALVIAAVLAAVIALFLVVRFYSDSVPGRLRNNVRELRQQYGELVRAANRVDRAERRLEKLERRAESVKPRRMQAAHGALEDARALQRIVEDKVMIAENRVRKLIVEEYSPKRQGMLRDRYLRRPERDGRPFSFG